MALRDEDKYSVDGDPPVSHFIEERIARDLQSGGTLVTRFPPEPNGHLHIGHAKSICLNFGLAQKFGGKCHVRFDDTNPEKESREYMEAIARDVAWLGFEWTTTRHASDYFPQLYAWAEWLVERGLAYVDSLPAEQIRVYRGTLTTPGRPSPDRDRSPAESLDLLRRMKAGEFADGACVLRARIDMAHPNINMRDPIIYRIRNARHPRTGNDWHIYPSYDFAHGQSDAIEGVTHSLCTLEFEDHRPLYDWLLAKLPVPNRPVQIEFSRVQLEYTVTSKRRLNELVVAGAVTGWDDPRMPTLSGMRRRGYPPAAIRDFCQRIGVTKKDNMIEISLLESCVRRSLEHTARRIMAVRSPLLVTIANWPKDEALLLDIPWYPDPAKGTRQVVFNGRLWIDGSDFMQNPPPRYYRLQPGGAVRLKYAFIIDCQRVVTDAQGKPIELICSYDPTTRSGQDNSGRKVRGAIQWVPHQAVTVVARNYAPLFVDPAASQLNQQSLEVEQLLVEPGIADLPPGEVAQFERIAFYCKDQSPTDGQICVNRTVTLRDSWGKKQGKQTDMPEK